MAVLALVAGVNVMILGAGYPARLASGLPVVRSALVG
jgi:hypothetical protein